MTGELFEQMMLGKVSEFVNTMKSLFGKFPEKSECKERKNKWDCFINDGIIVRRKSSQFANT